MGSGSRLQDAHFLDRLAAFAHKFLHQSEEVRRATIVELSPPDADARRAVIRGSMLTGHLLSAYLVMTPRERLRLINLVNEKWMTEPGMFEIVNPAAETATPVTTTDGF